jgi:Gluconate 2-dehydrogenase subunit 3
LAQNNRVVYKESQSIHSTSERGIGRRELLQSLLTGAGGAIVLPGLVSGHPMQHPADAATVATADAKGGDADWTPEFLDAFQNESLIALAERIVPGSTNTKVNRFIDLLLTVDTQENQKKFVASLGAFEAESRSRFGHSFQSLSEDQQDQLLTVASDAKSGNPSGNECRSWFSGPSDAPSGRIHVTLGDHFENLKSWITGAYYSSEVGMRELGWTGRYMFGGFPGCDHPDGHQLG